MKNTQIIALVAGASFVTFIISVVFSINMASISPKNLAKVIKADPETFINAIKEAGEEHQKQSAKKALEEQFKNPAKISTKGRVTFGNDSAPIAIVEFSDFQCPYCQMAAQSMRKLKDKYGDKVKMVYKHLPLSFHPFARPAAEYFEAVALISHEKARQFHDSIFDNFSDYKNLKGKQEINNKLKALVRVMGLDLNTVQSNMKKAKKTVAQDIAEAEKLSVRGTPSFFVNGVKTRELESVIEKFLKDME